MKIELDFELDFEMVFELKIELDFELDFELVKIKPRESSFNMTRGGGMKIFRGGSENF